MNFLVDISLAKIPGWVASQVAGVARRKASSGIRASDRASDRDGQWPRAGFSGRFKTMDKGIHAQHSASTKIPLSFSMRSIFGGVRWEVSSCNWFPRLGNHRGWGSCNCLGL